MAHYKENKQFNVKPVKTENKPIKVKNKPKKEKTSRIIVLLLMVIWTLCSVLSVINTVNGCTKQAKADYSLSHLNLLDTSGINYFSNTGLSSEGFRIFSNKNGICFNGTKYGSGYVSLKNDLDLVLSPGTYTLSLYTYTGYYMLNDNLVDTSNLDLILHFYLMFNGTQDYRLDLSSRSKTCSTTFTLYSPLNIHSLQILCSDYVFFANTTFYFMLNIGDIAMPFVPHSSNTVSFQEGYAQGYNQGVSDGSNPDYTFLGFFGSLVDAPLQAVTGLLNFDLLGFNMLNFFTALLTLCLIIGIIRLVL